MRGVNSILLNILLDFVYFGQVEVNASQINDFLALAQDLKVKGLTNSRQTENLNPIQKSSKLENSDEDCSDFGAENVVAEDIKDEEPLSFRIRTEAAKKIYPCTVCGKRSKSESALERHKYIKHAWRRSKTEYLDQFTNETLASISLGKKPGKILLQFVWTPEHFKRRPRKAHEQASPQQIADKRKVPLNTALFESEEKKMYKN